MTRPRGTGALAACVLGGAWLVGSITLALVGVGLVLATIVAVVWRQVVVRGLSVERRSQEPAPVEGEPLVIEAVVHGRTWLTARLRWHEPVETIGDLTAPVGHDGVARLVLEKAPRGRFRLDRGRLLATDPLGLSRAEIPAGRTSLVTVRPRVPELYGLFTETGTLGDGGRRTVARRSSGVEFHAVREYLEGEPLRAVHWPTSARRGELMVRELDDTPRESIAVVLDVDAASVVGPRGDSSLDDAVRAAAGLVRAHVLRSRNVLLAIATAEPLLQRVQGQGRDWELVLDALAAVEPSHGTALVDLVVTSSAVGGLPELVVVTGRPHVVADALIARAVAGAPSALVAVDTGTYAGQLPAETSPALLRLAGAGVAVAVIRHGVALPEALGRGRARAVV